MRAERRMARRTLIVLLVLTLLRTPFALWLRALLPDVTVWPEGSCAASILSSLLLFALPGWLLKPQWSMPALQTRERFGWGMVCVGSALAARAVVTPLHRWWTALLGIETAAMPHLSGLYEQALMALTVAVIPAIAEELLFHGALLPRLLQSGSRGQAVALTTLLFALMHGSPAGLPGHLLISLLLTLLMLHSGRLIVPVMVHMLYNLSALYWPETAAAVPWACGTVLCAFIGWLLIRLPEGRERRLAVSDGVLCAAILLVMAAQYLL